MAAVLRECVFECNPQTAQLKNAALFYHCNASIPCRCLQTTKSRCSSDLSLLFPLCVFVIFRALDSSIPTSRPTLELL